MIRLVLADDEATIRAGIAAILATAGDLETVAEAGDGRAAVEAVERHRPDVALLDIQMPVLDGLAAADEIARRVPGTATMMLTTFGDDTSVARSLALGVAGFVLKSGDPRELVLGVRAVAAGGAFLSPPVARRVIDGVGRDRMDVIARARAATASLTDRERDVLELVAEGFANAQIARRLDLAEATVKAHMTTIMRRLGVDNRVRAALVAHHAGLGAGSR